MPITPEDLSRGGKRRLETQSKWERELIARLAAHRRPLLNDLNLRDEQVLTEFRTDAARCKWIYFCIVGEDGRTIRHTLPDRTILQRLKLVRGAVGFCGVVLLPTKKTMAVYYRPLKKGTAATEKLEAKASEIKNELFLTMMEAVEISGLKKLER